MTQHTEQQKALQSQKMKEFWARKRQEQEEKKMAEQVTNTIEPDYKKLYTEECAKNRALENKLAEFEKLCKSFSERERQAVEALQRATLEYNARVKYMLDCVKHAHISMQFATTAVDNNKGGNQ